MKEDKGIDERFRLVQRELATLTEKVDCLTESVKELEELRQEIKGLKLFLGRVHPDFKSQFLQAVKKTARKG